MEKIANFFSDLKMLLFWALYGELENKNYREWLKWYPEDRKVHYAWKKFKANMN
jgi:hypothetical protein